MGTKLSKAKEGAAKEVIDKSATLPPSESRETEDVAKSETLPRNAFDRSSSFSKRFRKSMTKLVSKKKKTPEEKVEQETEAGSEPLNNEQEGDFKTAQQKARAEFFKEMYTPEDDNTEAAAVVEDDKTEAAAVVEETVDKEKPSLAEEKEVKDNEEEMEVKDEEEEKINVSLIGTPVEVTPEQVKKTVEEETQAEKTDDETKPGQKTV